MKLTFPLLLAIASVLPAQESFWVRLGKAALPTPIHSVAFSTPVTVDWGSFIAGPGCRPTGLGGDTCFCCGLWLGGVMILQPGGGYAWK